MIDINSLPLLSKLILAVGFMVGIISLIIFLRYPIMLILMKYNPKYREYIRSSIARKNKNKFVRAYGKRVVK
ncbi:MAG: hypothetical protein O8C61_08495 [Candidatus Methanoperedens sp.]|nr:hypothetical protein [Candidatus Methanoperedens sp.]